MEPARQCSLVLPSSSGRLSDAQDSQGEGGSTDQDAGQAGCPPGCAAGLVRRPAPRPVICLTPLTAGLCWRSRSLHGRCCTIAEPVKDWRRPSCCRRLPAWGAAPPLCGHRLLHHLPQRDSHHWARPGYAPIKLCALVKWSLLLQSGTCAYHSRLPPELRCNSSARRKGRCTAHRRCPRPAHAACPTTAATSACRPSS